MRRAAIPLALLLFARAALAEAPPEPEPSAPPAPTPGVTAVPPASPPAERAVPLVPAPPAPAPGQPQRFFLIPVLSYLPETGLGGGASTGLHLHLPDAPRPTSFFATALYTTERQGLLDLAADCALPGGAVLGARGRALHYPDRFYGIGRSTRGAAMEHFTRRSIELSAAAELPLPGAAGLRLGPRLELRAEEIRDVEPGGALAAGAVPGADGSSFAAAGLQATWDTRDGTFWPSRGSLAQAFYVLAPGGLSRTGAFGRAVLELRHFLPLSGGRVLGLHAYAERDHGEVPFTILPRLGNTRFLRGIREGRYRDRTEWATQAELRSPLFWRISGTAFAALGDVGPSLSNLRFDRPKVAGGAGLRYRLTDEGANVRLDVAASRFGVQFYVLVLEAF